MNLQVVLLLSFDYIVIDCFFFLMGKMVVFSSIKSWRFSDYWEYIPLVSYMNDKILTALEFEFGNVRPLLNLSLFCSYRNKFKYIILKYELFPLKIEFIWKYEIICLMYILITSSTLHIVFL